MPRRAVEALGFPSHFQVEIEDGWLVLIPARLGAADAVRRKLASLGLVDSDVTDAVAWARKTS